MLTFYHALHDLHQAAVYCFAARMPCPPSGRSAACATISNRTTFAPGSACGTPLTAHALRLGARASVALTGPPATRPAPISLAATAFSTMPRWQIKIACN